MKKKKLHFLNLIAVFSALFSMYACSVSTINHYYADKKMSFATDIDMSQGLEMMDAFMPDSLKQNSDFMNTDKYPKEWKSLYDLKKEEGKVNTNPDSIRLLKKIFFKGNFNQDKFSGFSVKTEVLTKDEIASTGKLMGKDAAMMNNSAFDDWNGKTLTISTKKLQISQQEIQDIFKTGEQNSGENKEQIESMLGMMQIDFKNKLIFDNKIKSVKGQHDWIKKIDDKTMEVTINLQEMMDKNHQFKNKDEMILIETE